MYLTKSDFILADDCLVKLYFKKNGFQSGTVNPYMDYLARIGNITGYIAKHSLGPGSETPLDKGLERALLETKKWIESTKRGVLFEATFEIDGRLVRVDVLRKEGSTIELIEVKSSGFDSLQWYCEELERKKLLKQLGGEIKDLAFQTAVVERALPDFEVEPYLSLIDKNVINEIEGLYGNFQVTTATNGALSIEYLGDIDELTSQFLLFEPISLREEINAVKENIWLRSELMIEALGDPNDFAKFNSPPKMTCGQCEFRLKGKDLERSGYAKCLGVDAFVTPHVLSIRRDAALFKLLSPLVE